MIEEKLFNYLFLSVKYNKFIKHVFINIIEHSFPQFLNDVVLKIYSFQNFELNEYFETYINQKEEMILKVEDILKEIHLKFNIYVPIFRLQHSYQNFIQTLESE